MKTLATVNRSAANRAVAKKYPAANHAVARKHPAINPAAADAVVDLFLPFQTFLQLFHHLSLQMEINYRIMFWRSPYGERFFFF